MNRYEAGEGAESSHYTGFSKELWTVDIGILFIIAIFFLACGCGNCFNTGTSYGYGYSSYPVSSMCGGYYY